MDAPDFLTAVPEANGARERLYRHLVENSLGLMCVHDLDGVLLYVNPAAAETLQWQPEDGVGRNLREYLAPSVQPFFEDYLTRIRRNSTDRGLMVLVAKDGTERIWSYRNVRLELPGVPACVLGHAMDVTEQVRTRQALREVQRVLEERDSRHQTLVEGSPVGIAIDQDGVVRFANSAVARMHGYDSPADLVGRPLAMLLTAQEWQHVADFQTAGSRCAETAGERVEVQHVRRDGSPIWVERWSSVVTWERRPAVLTTFVDITDRKRLEERVRQIDRLEAVGRLAGGVAHHVNNQMTIVMGWAAILKETPDKGDSRQQRLETIQRAAGQAAMLAQHLLAFSRRQILQPLRLNVSEFISAHAALIRETCGGRRRVDVDLALEPEVWPVNADPAQLEYGLLALVANACDAMPDGGRLTLRTGNIEIDETVASRHPGMRPGAYVELAVEDTGIGMSEEVLARVFEPFFTTKDVGQGTGLSLASVYGIVKQHEGYIAVDSRPGGGSRFRIYLPARHAGFG